MKNSILITLITLFSIVCYSQNPLTEYPILSSGEAEAGRQIPVTENEYKDTEVHHLIYLPTNYDSRQKTPIIVEYGGNKWQYGNGTVEEAKFGFSITLGRDFIWVVLPYISADHTHNQPLWWGDADATAHYAEMVIPRIIKKYNGDENNVILCGFSRGSIAASYIGLSNDNIAQLWSAFITHDHFDGEREWRGTSWGVPLDEYRTKATQRLSRLNGRPWLISTHNKDNDYQKVISELEVENYEKFTYLHIDMNKRFDTIPNKYINHPHSDKWAIFDFPESNELRKWLYDHLQK